MEYIKSPLNYTGGKFKLLKQIIPLFPREIDTFVDLFGGGFNVGINVTANSIVYNDTNAQVVEMLRCFKRMPLDKLISQIDEIIAEYSLTKENQEGFIEFRKRYNMPFGDVYEDSVMLYVLICFAFNNQIRFNSLGEYNMPFGKNRSSFNDTLRNKFIKFCERLYKIKVDFENKSFNKFDFEKLGNSDFVYCDPPYFNSIASYNENGGWTENDEKTLLSLLDTLNEKGIKWALSNNLKYENHILAEFCKKYKVHELSHSYGNCSYQKKDKSNDREVLITNY